MANGIVLNIDTTKSEFQNPMIELRQGDGNYQSLDVTVTSNGSPFNLTGWTITFMGTTAGGYKIIDAVVSNVDTTNGKFTYTPTKAWGQDEGMFKEAYFKFTSGVNGNSVASGASIRVNVLTAVDLTAEEAGDYISIVDQTIATLNEDLTTLQSSVDQLKAQNNAIKTTDNTWSGSNTFNKEIIAPAGVRGNASSADVLTTRLATFTDFADVAKNMIMYSGNWYTSGVSINNGPLTTGYGLIQVMQGDSSRDGYILFSNWPNNKTYIVHVNNNLLGAWSLLNNDSTTVHNTGTETVAGNKTFTGDNNFSGATTLKTGNYGLRVTTAGIQKTSDNGVTWTNI